MAGVVALRPHADPAKRIKAKILFQQERFADIVPDLGPLWRLHDRELWPGRKWGKLKPDTVFYLMAENQAVTWGGRQIPTLQVLTARTGGGRLIGYCFEFIRRDPHYETLVSFNDTIFLHPDYRVGKGLSLKHQPGVRLLKEREAMLDKLGIERRRIGFKVWRQVGPILERVFGYKADMMFYHKAVEDNE